MVSQSVADELAALGFPAAAAESGEPRTGEADAPTQEKEVCCSLHFRWSMAFSQGIRCIEIVFHFLGIASAGITRKSALKDVTPTKRGKKSVKLFPSPPPLRAATSVWIS